MSDAPGWLDELAPSPGPPWHALGTRTVPDRAWLLVDDQRAVQLAAKRTLLADAHDVVAGSLPGPAAWTAAIEAADVVATAAGGDLDPCRAPLEAAALLVQDDLCVLTTDDGGWRLVAGVVCFPSLWRLPDKLGLRLADVHGPVPAYAEEVAGRVDRLLDGLRPGRPVRRRNWLVHDDPALHQPVPHPPDPRRRDDRERDDAPAVPDGLWLRSERQVLQRLPRTGAVLFSIGTQQAPLACLAARPDLRATLAAAIASWSPALVSYRGAERWRDPVLAWLRAPGTSPEGAR